MKSHAKASLVTTLGARKQTGSSLIINEINWCIEESNDNKCLLLGPADKAKTLAKYAELWNKVRDVIRSMTNNSDNYDGISWFSCN